MLRREFDARAKARVDGTWLTRKLLGKLTGPDAPAAIRMRDAFSLDPYRACLGLSAAAASRGAVIFERSRVKKVKVARRHVDVIAEGGTVRASTIIVTTGTASLEFRQLRRHFKRRESYLVLTESMPAAIRKQIGTRDTTFRDTRDASSSRAMDVRRPDSRLPVPRRMKRRNESDRPSSFSERVS